MEYAHGMTSLLTPGSLRMRGDKPHKDDERDGRTDDQQKYQRWDRDHDQIRKTEKKARVPLE